MRPGFEMWEQRHYSVGLASLQRGMQWGHPNQGCIRTLKVLRGFCLCGPFSTLKTKTKTVFYNCFGRKINTIQDGFIIWYSCLLHSFLLLILKGKEKLRHFWGSWNYGGLKVLCLMDSLALCPIETPLYQTLLQPRVALWHELSFLEISGRIAPASALFFLSRREHMKYTEAARILQPWNHNVFSVEEKWR